MSGNNKANLVLEITQKTVNNLKSTIPPLVSDFLRAAQKYQQQCAALANAGLVLAEAVIKIGSTTRNEIGEGLKSLGEIIKEQEIRREEMSKALIVELINPVRVAMENDQKEVLQFEKNYKKERDNLVAEILKLEAKTKKVTKKTSPDELKNNIQTLNDKIKEAEVIRGTRLRDSILLERKKYANFLSSWNRIVSLQIKNLQEAIDKYVGHEGDWTTLATSWGVLPPEYGDLITMQERTLVQIQTDEAGSSQMGYNYQNTYDTTIPEKPVSQTDQVRVLYDYVPEAAEDLPLTAGEIITVLQHDDGSGWTKGLNQEGREGIFPSSYAEYC